MSEIATHVAAAVGLALSNNPSMDATPEAVHAFLWAHVKQAVDAERGAMDLPPIEQDKRIKPWLYVARFWDNGPIGPELIGETDPTLMNGTGELPSIIRTLAAEVHETNTLPPKLAEEHLKTLLPQLRNNLGRGNNATLRINYCLENIEAAPDYICQVDVFRLS